MIELKIGDYFVKIDAANTRAMKEPHYNDSDTMNFLCSIAVELWTAERLYRKEHSYALARRVDKMSADIYDALVKEGYFQ